MDQEELKKILDDNRNWVESNGTSGRRADLTNLNLTGANFTDADLRNAILVHTDFAKAILASANLSGANLSSANLSDAILVHTDFTKAILAGANLSGADLTRADLSGTYLTSTKLMRTKLTRTKLMGACLLRANLNGADLVSADLLGANLMDVNLADADLRGANLTDARLTDSDLRGANLTDADLRDANLMDVNLTDANLTNAIALAQNQLNSAFITDAGKPPKGLADLKAPPVRDPQDDHPPEQDAEADDNLDEQPSDEIISEVDDTTNDDPTSDQNETTLRADPADRILPSDDIRTPIAPRQVILVQGIVLRRALSELLGDLPHGQRTNRDLPSDWTVPDDPLLNELRSLRDSIDQAIQALEEGHPTSGIIDTHMRRAHERLHDYFFDVASGLKPDVIKSVGMVMRGGALLLILAQTISLFKDSDLNVDDFAKLMEVLVTSLKG